MLEINSNHSSMILKNSGNHEKFLFFKEFLVSKKVASCKIAKKALRMGF